MNEHQSNWEFGCLANTCGIFVEYGADPAIPIEPILDRITEQLRRVPEFVGVMQEQLGVEHPNQIADHDWPRLGQEHPDHAWVIGEWYALQFTGCAAMTMLVRNVAARKKARERIDLIQRAESARSDNPYAYYLAELLGMVDGERLLVLDTERKLGFHVHLTAIRNNFHLFTLLQDALLAHSSARAWSGPRGNALAVAVAKSERMLYDISPNEWGPAGEVDSALWTYSIRGEGKPTEIPLLDGERIVLLGPLETPRSWNCGFFVPLHSDLRSAVVVESVLSDEEYRVAALQQ
jgi:hypothetical protein